MHSIRTKMFVLTLAAVLISVLSFGLIGINLVRVESTRTSTEKLSLICENRKATLNEYLHSIQQSVSIVSNYAVDTLDEAALTAGGVAGAQGTGVHEIEGRAPEQRQDTDRYLKDHLAFIEGEFRSIANHTNGIASYYYRLNPEITTSDMGFFYSKTATSDFRKTELTDIAAYDPDDYDLVGWYFVPLTEQRPVWLRPYYSEIMDDWVISYVIPVYAADTFIGVIGMDIRFETLVTQIRQFSDFQTGYFALTGEDGTIYYRPSFEVGDAERGQWPQVSGFTDQLVHESSGAELIRYQRDDTTWQLTFSTLANGMKLVAVVEEAEINAPLYHLARLFAVCALAILLVFGVICALVSRRLSDPLKRLSDAATRMGAGDLGVEVAYEGRDEVGTLTTAFRTMSDQLRRQFADLTEQLEERRRLQEALSAALVEAEEASKAKTSFLSSMSHEIRTPMNAIIGLDTLALRDETLSDQTRGYLERIGASARHLLSLINDILDMSRIESGRMTLTRERFSFVAMLEQINTMVMLQCKDKGLSYECHVLGHVDDAYVGDDTKLQAALLNILGNAVKFTEAPGSVSMSVERVAVFEDQSTLRFVVTDTGIGMDADFVPKIFDAFTQEDGSRTNRYGSAGLGLAISKRILDMMNGTIEVQSEKGVGSTFTVTVTLRNCEPQDRDMEIDIDTDDIHVLVADGDEVAAEHTRLVLDEIGIRSDVCATAGAALAMLDVKGARQEPYNLIILDGHLDDTGATRTCAKVRERLDPSSCVILLAAYNADDIMVEAAEAGADGVLNKPLFASNIIEAFNRAARRNKLRLLKERGRAELAGRRVLLAEDIKINAEIVEDLLSLEDVEVDHALNGRIAVDMFAASEPGTYDAVLMDIRMPEMDGLEAASAIRATDHADARRIPIIAVSANALDEDVQRSLQAGMDAHLTKPVDADRLFTVLAELIYEAEEGETRG